jgi:hypothetical protein
MSRKTWHCPYCEMMSSRHWNVKRHLYAKHNGIGEPIYYDTSNSTNKVSVNAYNVSRTVYPYYNDFTAIPKSFHKGYDFGDTLNFMRKMVEFKDLLTQLQPTFTPPVGRVCLNCLNPIYIPVFLKVDGKNEMFEPQHECLEPGLYSIEEKEEVLKISHINLIKLMSILIKAWLVWENCMIWAKEIDAHTPIIGEIKTNQKDHWSARAIKDNFTELKDDNELADFLAKTIYSTFGVFKVYLNQQSSSKFYRFMIIKKEWLL